MKVALVRTTEQLRADTNHMFRSRKQYHESMFGGGVDNLTSGERLNIFFIKNDTNLLLPFFAGWLYISRL